MSLRLNHDEDDYMRHYAEYTEYMKVCDDDDTGALFHLSGVKMASERY